VEPRAGVHDLVHVFFLRIDVPQKKRQASKNIAVLVKDEQ
jgi:hypothetical protein